MLISTIGLIFGVVEQVKRETLLFYSFYILHADKYFAICRENVKMNLSRHVSAWSIYQFGVDQNIGQV